MSVLFIKSVLISPYRSRTVSGLGYGEVWTPHPSPEEIQNVNGTWVDGVPRKDTRQGSDLLDKDKWSSKEGQEA